MKQILQNIRTGETILEELPTPAISRKSILIRTNRSLVSLGTERMLVEFGKSSIIQKARQQPDKVKQVLDKMRTDGVLPTLEAIFNKLDQPIPLGYCNVGEVIEVGEDVTEFKIGDRVASNGAHAEIISVPKNLAVKIPESVNDDEATFTVIGSIGLQGIRLLNPSIGETIVVYGLGLIGLISAQLLKMNGCNVIGIDIDDDKCSLAEKLGITSINVKHTDPNKFILHKTSENGCDGVLITASSKSNEIISQSAKMCRKKGSIVLIGVVDLELNRNEFYEKELSFQVSCSYGPGRYDEMYEQQGVDYPFPYVRWTEKRNFEAILNAIASSNLNVKDLITKKVDLNEYKSIYKKIDSSKTIASILKYSQENKDPSFFKNINFNKDSYKEQKAVLGIIGSGNFTRSTILPCLSKTKARIKYISSSNGISSTLLAKKYNIDNSTTDYNKIISNDEIDTVIIATRHDSHSKYVIESLEAGKNTFVEKPLAINEEQLNKIIHSLNNSPNSQLTVGYNRRFSPHIEKIKKTMGLNCGPINIIANMNAGFIEKNHWVNDLEIGGGRIIGEACHLIDLCTFLTNSLVSSVCMSSMGKEFNVLSDNASIILKFMDGSNATINYFSNGSKKYNKERVEIYSNQRTWVLDNYTKTTAFGVKNFKSMRSRLDKGHRNQFKRLIENIRLGHGPLISLDQIINVSKTSLAALESLRSNKWINV